MFLWQRWFVFSYCILKTSFFSSLSSRINVKIFSLSRFSFCYTPCVAFISTLSPVFSLSHSLLSFFAHVKDSDSIGVHREREKFYINKEHFAAAFLHLWQFIRFTQLKRLKRRMKKNYYCVFFSALNVFVSYWLECFFNRSAMSSTYSKVYKYIITIRKHTPV